MEPRKSLLKDRPSLQLDYGKIPPQARDLEEAILGACLIESTAFQLASRIIRTHESFYVDAHQRIYKAMLSLNSKRSAIDLLTVTEELKLSGDLEASGGPYAISLLTNKVGSAANIETHCLIVKEKWVQRNLISVSTDVIQKSYDDTSDCFDVLNTAQTALGELLAEITTGVNKTWASEIDDYNTKLQEARSRPVDDRYIIGLRTGLYPLDRKILGLQDGDLILLAGRPSEGKSSLMLQAVRENCRAGIPVGVFSLEMSFPQIISKLVAMESGLDMERIRTATLTHEEWGIYEMAMAAIRKWPLFVNDRSGLAVSEIRSIALNWLMQHGIKLLCIDYLQLARSGNIRTVGSREQEVSYISGAMKGLAKELAIPVLALSQMSRDMEKRDAKHRRPQLSDLRDSGSLEQDADNVIFIFRPEKHGILVDEDGNSTEGFTELIVAKNRMGALAILKAGFEGKFSRFVDDSTYPHSYSKVEAVGDVPY